MSDLERKLNELGYLKITDFVYTKYLRNLKYLNIDLDIYLPNLNGNIITDTKCYFTKEANDFIEAFNILQKDLAVLEKYKENQLNVSSNDNTITIPKIDQEIYMITYVSNEPYSLTKGKVFMMNDSSFIVENMLGDGYISEYRKPLNFKDEGITWFRTFNAAEEYIKSKGYSIKYEIDSEWSINETR